MQEEETHGQMRKWRRIKTGQLVNQARAKMENQKKREENTKLPLGPINLDTQGPITLYTPAGSSPIQFGPPTSVQAQFDMGSQTSKIQFIWIPEESKAQLKWASATSKMQTNSWALHLRPKSSVQFLSTWLSRPPAPDGSVHFHGHISNISQTRLFIIFVYV